MRRKGHVSGRADDSDLLRRYTKPKNLVNKGIDLPGQPDIEPSCYRCPEHGLVLAQDVRWDRDDHPHCPHCDTLLMSE